MTVPDKYRDEYINFDEIEDVLTSVGLVARLAPQVEAKPTCWKWIIVAAHSGLQGAMVCAFSDSSETSILTKKSAKETLDYFHADENQRGKYQREQMAPFYELLKRRIKRSPTCEPLALTRKQCRDIRGLNTLRNDFVHFTPKGWRIEKVGLPRIIGVVLDVTEELMKRPRLLQGYDESWRERFAAVLHTARNALGLPAASP